MRLAVVLLVLAGVLAPPGGAEAAPSPDPLTVYREQLRSPTAGRRLVAVIRLGWLGPAAAPALPELKEALRDRDDRVAHEAANTLVRVGPRAVPVLAEAWSDGRRLTRWRALDALRRLGPEARAAVPDLAAMLERDDSIELRILAAQTLGRLGPEAREALPALTRAVRDRANLGGGGFADHPSSVCAAAAEAVARIDPTARKAVAEAALPALLSMLRGDSGVEQREVARALAQLAPFIDPALPALRDAALASHGYLGPAVEALIAAGPGGQKLLLDAIADQNLDAQTRCFLLRDAAFRGRLSAGTVPALVRLLKDPDGALHGFAALALANQGEAAAPAIHALIEALADPAMGQLNDGTFTYLPTMPAAEALARIGPEAVPALLEAVKAPGLRGQALVALERMGPRARAALPALRVLLGEEDKRLKAGAASALLHVGDAPEAPLRVLAALLADPDRETRRSAVEALERSVGGSGERPVTRTLALPREAVKPLLELLKDQDLRGPAGRVLGRMGDARKDALPELIARCENGDSAARSILLELGPDAAPAVPALLRSVDPKAADVYQTYTKLGRIGPAARDAVPVLLAAVRDPHNPGRGEALVALAGIGAGGEEAVSTLRKVLEDTESAGPGGARPRYLAAYALGGFGPAARSARPALEKALVDEDALVRVCATGALAGCGRRRRLPPPAVARLAGHLRSRRALPGVTALAGRRRGLGPGRGTGCPAAAAATGRQPRPVPDRRGPDGRRACAGPDGAGRAGGLAPPARVGRHGWPTGVRRGGGGEGHRGPVNERGSPRARAGAIADILPRPAREASQKRSAAGYEGS
jgi:HEAT repeat protein